MIRDSLPLLVPMAEAPKVLGLSRSALYRAAARGEIAVRKLGRSALVDTASVLAFIEGLPRATIRSGGAAEADARRGTP
ncbi:MAG: helix-turn-helix domain-containing protein [Roseococcus sp.]|nr:helix-turn-helix domain-containing protein [Roseococcus sp.]